VAKPKQADTRTIRRILTILSNFPGASKYKGDGFELEFTPQQVPAQAVPRSAPGMLYEPGQAPHQAVATVPGTPFPDDGTPLNDADLVLFPPDLDMSVEN
jgi:hypothetical protein